MVRLPAWPKLCKKLAGILGRWEVALVPDLARKMEVYIIWEGCASSQLDNKILDFDFTTAKEWQAKPGLGSSIFAEMVEE